jgi:rubrerythrin
MSMRFNADDVLEMALEIERNGAAFYTRAAELQQDPHGRATLLELAAMEEDHEKTFADMRDGLTAEERKETTHDPVGQLPLYLRAMADKQVFDTKASPADRLTGKESVADLLRYAIGMEKDSIVFYIGLQELVPERVGAARVGHIIKEEMGHIATLGDLMRCSHP